MIQSLTKPEEGETAAESIQIALAASAPNDGTTASPIHTPAASRRLLRPPDISGQSADMLYCYSGHRLVCLHSINIGRSFAGLRRVGGPQGPLLLQQPGRVGDDELPHIRASPNLERRVPRPRPISLEKCALNFCPCRYILFVTVVTSWWLGITFGNAAYFAVITFTTVGLGDFAPPSRPASRRRVDGVGVEAAARAGSSTTTRRTPTWSASTSSSRRRRCWASCCWRCSSRRSTSSSRRDCQRASTASPRASWPCGGATRPTARGAGGAGGGRVVDLATTRVHLRRRRRKKRIS